MIAAHGEPNAVAFDVTAGAQWLRTSAQVSDDRAVLVVQLVNTVPGNFSSTVEVSVTGFAPGGVVELWTLSVPNGSPWGDQKTDGNTPGDSMRIAPRQTHPVVASGRGFAERVHPGLFLCARARVRGVKRKRIMLSLFFPFHTPAARVAVKGGGSAPPRPREHATARDQRAYFPSNSQTH